MQKRQNSNSSKETEITIEQQELFKKYQLKCQEYQGYIEQLQETNKEYDQLIERLRTLPEKLKHEIMVPMGKKAFFEGTIKNSNQVLLLLGDNYFTKRSSKQSRDILMRRRKDVTDQINQLKQEIAILSDRKSLTQHISTALSEKERDDIREIKEEYDSDEEKEKELIKKKSEQSVQPIQRDEKELLLEKEEMNKEFDEIFRKLLILEEKENSKLNKTDASSNNDDDDDDNDDNKDEEEDDEDDSEDENSDNYNDDEDEYHYDEENNYLSGLSRGENEFDNNFDDNEEIEITEYYDEEGNLVDINDPNFEYVQEEEDHHDDEDYNEKSNPEFDINNVQVQDFYLNNDGQTIDLSDLSQIKSFYQEKKKNRPEFSSPIQISLNPTSLTSTTTTTTTTASQTKSQSIPTPNKIATTTTTTSSSSSPNVALSTSPSIKSILKGSLENDPRDYIKKVNKQVHFEAGIKMPERQSKPQKKSLAFNGDIVEKDSLMFEFEMPIAPPTTSKGKHHNNHNQHPQHQQQQQPQQQSRFKSSRNSK
ncbi:RNA polymerase II subunit 5-mediating protein [Tieghemostelium lacteum]|uniref:RNA polymerase II subunit 5-mediating protein n=1 Tax=Tieghemostelium lacteum TaxID=361077 RepID=A0A151ZH74_TIELA|nr:RNA polymerase II subunit 5-mediating protein [Tieghemostelium lacteum]|eukprot:KYQ93214.1 RNA polymerase II subunit 5-mediating protein [Tieghemostelium lacteum]